MKTKAKGIEFDLVCKPGQMFGYAVEQARADLAGRVMILQNAEDDGTVRTAAVADEVRQMRARVDTAGTTLVVHVGHCDDCIRVTAFTGLTSYDRAPHRSKPRLPAMATISARIQAGETVDDIAAEYERDTHTLRLRLNQAGYSTVTKREPKNSTRRPPSWEIVSNDGTWDPWRDDALCSQTDPEEFFPERGGSSRSAKAVCANCTVSADCLQYALEHNVRFGIWGGLSERERRKVDRAQVAS